MKRFFNFLIFPILPLLASLIIALLFVISLFTPDKAPSGQYTDPVAYWLDDSEFNK